MSRISPETKLADIDIVFLDFETTGFSKTSDRVIEIGAIKYRNKKEIARFEVLVDPQKPLPEKITEITGIKPQDLKGKPKFRDVSEKFLDFLRGSLIVAHNASFDMGFLKAESSRAGVECNYLSCCTVKMAKELTSLKSRKLDALAQHYGLQFEARHRSVGDALVTAQAFFAMIRDSNINIVKDLERFQ